MQNRICWEYPKLLAKEDMVNILSPKRNDT